MHERVIVIDVSEEKNELRAFINPEIVWSSDAKQIYEEGCLSVPDRDTGTPIYAKTPRAAGVTVRGLNRLGKPVQIKARGLLARCFQHETDHLDGLLYVDRLAKDAARKVLLQAP